MYVVCLAVCPPVSIPTGTHSPAKLLKLQHPAGTTLQTSGRLCLTHTVAYSKASSCEVNKKTGELPFGFADGHISTYLSSKASCPVYCACRAKSALTHGEVSRADVDGTNLTGTLLK